ncbi:PQQ-binding-like beta-propeller repeat protein [Chamaesiphon sp.]|uniref:outer membrane protein assembly factor BamB family protein n=1 Tax=Chamaesiphon sp. TaxID=2814140 RepID=UPI003593FA7F
MKRTDNDTLSDIHDAPDLQNLVCDKRAGKRATTASNRRNRRYENRILTAQTCESEDAFAEDNQLKSVLAYLAIATQDITKVYSIELAIGVHLLSQRNSQTSTIVTTTNRKHHPIVNIIGKLALISIPVALIGSLVWNYYLNENQAALIALDANSGKYLWSSALDNDISRRQRLAIDRDRVFMQVGTGPNLGSTQPTYGRYKIVALSTKSGREIWSSPPPGQSERRIVDMSEVSSPLRVERNKLWLNTIVSDSPILQVESDGNEVDTPRDRRRIRPGKVMNFDAQTGKTNWSIDRNLGNGYLEYDRIATNDSTTAILKLSSTLDINIEAYNSSSGKQLWKTIVTKFDPKSTDPVFDRYRLVANSGKIFVVDRVTAKMSGYQWDTGKLISQISLNSDSTLNQNNLIFAYDTTVYLLSNIPNAKISNTKITALDPNTGSRRWDLDPNKCSYLEVILSLQSGTYAACVFSGRYNEFLNYGILAIDSKTGREMWLKQSPLGNEHSLKRIVSNSKTVYTMGFDNDNVATALANTDGKERWKWQPPFGIYEGTTAVDENRFFVLASVPRWRLILKKID